MNTFGDLRAAVHEAMARTDIPSYVYALTTAELNDALRLREMEATATLTPSGDTITLPANYLMARVAYLDDDPREVLEIVSGFQQVVAHRESGRPATLNVFGDVAYLNPAPDAVYSVVLRYVAALADFVNTGDTNDVLLRYPGVYLYGALKHAAVWAKDAEAAQTYSAAHAAAMTRAERSDRLGRHGGGPLRSRVTAAP